MKSKVFSIDFHTNGERHTVGIYRTSGKRYGGGLRFYSPTAPSLIRLLRAMVNVSIRVPCYTRETDRSSTWTVANVVSEMYAAEAALKAS